MDINTKKFLQSIASKTQEAAEDAKHAMQNAGKMVSEKYDSARVGLELTRVRGDQEHIFADIGRAVFFMNTGAYTQNLDGSAPQQTIDALLIAAEQKQHEIDALSDRQAELNKNNKCPVCKHICAETDTFCSACGSKISN